MVNIRKMILIIGIAAVVVSIISIRVSEVFKRESLISEIFFKETLPMVVCNPFPECFDYPEEEEPDKEIIFQMIVESKDELFRSINQKESS